MSKVKLKHASGNSVSIAAPQSNPASDRTLYVPSNANGTILTTTSPKAGNIIQVISTTKTDTFSETINSGNWSAVVTGLTAVITPSSTSNKILIHYTVNVAGNFPYLGLDKGGSVITGSIGAAAGSRTRATMSTYTGYDNTYTACIAGNYLDSPSSTSALTYGIRIRHSSSSTQTGYVNRSKTDTDEHQISRSASVITVMEVAG